MIKPHLAFSIVGIVLCATAAVPGQEGETDEKMAAAEQCLVVASIEPSDVQAGFALLQSERRDVLIDCLQQAGIQPWDFARATREPMHPL